MREIEAMWMGYGNYLIDTYLRKEKSRYGKLFERLHQIKFYTRIARDRNRMADGEDLRADYCETMHDERSISRLKDHWCSVLEMMLGLSIRVDNELIGDPSVEHPEAFLMQMVHNLGLLKFRKKGFPMDDVRPIIERWLDRDFDYSGEGSPFPLKNADRDQRNVEIWDQMNAYVYENYF